MAKKTTKNKKNPGVNETTTKKTKTGSAKSEAASSPAFATLKAAYDAGNFSLTQKLAKNLDGMSVDEKSEALRLAKLSGTDPVALAIGVGVVLLVLIVSWTLLTPA